MDTAKDTILIAGAIGSVGRHGVAQLLDHALVAV